MYKGPYSGLYKAYEIPTSDALVDKTVTEVVEEPPVESVDGVTLEPLVVEDEVLRTYAPISDVVPPVGVEEVKPEATAVEVQKEPATIPEVENIGSFDLSFLTRDDRTRIFDSQIWAESLYGDPRYMKSGAGAQGIAQFMPKTWRWAQEMGWIEQGADVMDEKSSLQAQKHFMEHLYRRPAVSKGDTEEERIKRMLASYNWGIGYLTKAILRAEKETGNKNDWIKYAPSETKKYIAKIFKRTTARKESGVESQYSWYD